MLTLTEASSAIWVWPHRLCPCSTTGMRQIVHRKEDHVLFALVALPRSLPEDLFDTLRIRPLAVYAMLPEAPRVVPKDVIVFLPLGGEHFGGVVEEEWFGVPHSVEVGSVVALLWVDGVVPFVVSFEALEWRHVERSGEIGVQVESQVLRPPLQHRLHPRRVGRDEEVEVGGDVLQ